MKYLFVALLGVLLGAAASGALLYYNPLTDEQAGLKATPDRKLRYHLPDDALTFIRGERTFLPKEPVEADMLWEDTIERTALLGVTLHDADGAPVAVGSRLIAGSKGTDLLLRGLMVSDYWIITFPGEGSVFVRAENNLWPLLTDTVIPARYFERPLEGPVDHHPTAGPAPSGEAIAHGATGAFAASDGTAVERYRLSALAPLAVDAELDLMLLERLQTAAE